MAKYVIGDIHGCGTELELLLRKINFNPSQDLLYLIGDLVGRGPEPKKVLDLAIANQALITLGNWDLHFLCCLAKVRQAKSDDSFSEIMTLPTYEQDKYRDWLLQQQLIINDPNFLLVHASVSPIWSLEQVVKYGQDAMEFIRQVHQTPYYDQFKQCFSGLFIDGLRNDCSYDIQLRHNLETLIVLTINREQVLTAPNSPSAIFLQKSLQEQYQAYQAYLQTEQQFALNSNIDYCSSNLTSMLHNNSQPCLQSSINSIATDLFDISSHYIQLQGQDYSTLVRDYSRPFIDFDRCCKGLPVYDFDKGYFPWYAAQEYMHYLQMHHPKLLQHNPNLVFHKIDKPIFFGHWSMLNGQVLPPGFICTDTSCVYGGHLSAYLLPETLITNEQELMNLAQPLAQIARITNNETRN